MKTSILMTILVLLQVTKCVQGDPFNPTCYDGAWTRYFDLDDPSGNGDYETMASIKQSYPGEVCDNPTDVDGRVLHGAIPWHKSGEVLTVTVANGLSCVNSEQPAGKTCSDYKVRFCCKRSVTNPTCDNGDWTRWFDRDAPGGNGDYETLATIRDWYPGEACENPLEVDGRLLNGQHWATSGEVLTVTPATGLSCVNEEQRAGKYCSDYKVRFCCKKSESSDSVNPTCYDGAWTRYFDLDDPSGNGDYETMASIKELYPGQVCDSPSAVDGRVLHGAIPWHTSGEVLTVTVANGLSCVNSEQPAGKTCSDYKVRFCCKRSVTNPTCDDGDWTRWFNRDHPSGNGDYETLATIREWYPGKACETPLAVDGRLLNGQHWATSGEVLTVTPATGLSCVNEDQRAGKYCSDYKVRFCCKKSNCQDGVPEFCERRFCGNFLATIFCRKPCSLC